MEIGEASQRVAGETKGQISVTSKAVVPDSSGGKSPYEDKVPIAESVPTRFQAYTHFDYGFYDQDALRLVVVLAHRAAQVKAVQENVGSG